MLGRSNNISVSETNVTTSDNLFSIDNVNAISLLFSEAIQKLNWTASLIKNKKDEIVAAKSYSQVIRPVFELKYGPQNEKDDFNILMFQLERQNIMYFFQSQPSFDDKYIYQVPSPYNTRFKDMNEKYYDPTVKLIQNNASILSSNRLYNFIFGKDMAGEGISICMQHIMKDVLDENKYMIVSIDIDISRKMPNIYSYTTIPPAFTKYLTTIQQAFNYFSKTEYDTTKGTIYQHGSNSEFKMLKVVSSPTYPMWDGQYISDSYIPGSNIDIPNVMYQIHVGINRDYPTISEGQIVIVNYAIGPIYYTGIIKMIQIVGNDRLCYQVLSININNIFPTSVKMTGDVDIQGNLDVLNYNGDPILITDNTRKVVSVHDKMGINQKPFEVTGLLDIDNLTQQTVLDIFNNFVTYSVNSYDITQVIIAEEGCHIPGLFDQGNQLFDYTNQCTVFCVPIKAILTTDDVTIIHTDGLRTGIDIGIGKSILAAEHTFKRLQLLVKEINQMAPEIENAQDPSFIFSFMELVQTLDKRWYVISMRAIIDTKRHNEEPVNNLIFTMTYMDVHNIMVDDSTGNTLLEIINYSSKEHSFINYVSLLFKNNAFYDSDHSLAIHASGNPLIQVAIKTNDFFSDRLGLLPESYIYSANMTNKGNETFLIHEAVPFWNNKSVKDLWNKDTNVHVVLDIIETQREKLYNNSINSTSVVNYVWDAVQKIAFTNMIIVDHGNGPQEFLIGSGFNLNSLLPQSLIVNGDNTISGNFSVNDSNKNVIFKVDNVKKNITNSYKVGIGTDNPKSILDIKDTTVMDVLYELRAGYQQWNLLNKVAKKLCDVGNNVNTSFDENTDFKTIINDVLVGQNTEQTVDNYYCLVELNMNTMLVDDVVFLSHWLYPHWNGQAAGTIQDGVNRASLQLIKDIITYMLDTQLIFHYSTNVSYANFVFGRKLRRTMFLQIGEKMYLLSTGTNIQSYNLRADTNANLITFLDARLHMCMVQNRVYSDSIMNIMDPINDKENFNQLRMLNKKDSDIQFTTFIFTIDVINKSDTTIQYIHVSDDDLTVVIDPLVKIVDIPDDNLITKYNNFWIKYITGKYKDDMFVNDNNAIDYEDLYDDFLTGLKCIGVSSDRNVFTLLCTEIRIQEIVLPTLNVKGDTKLVGDLIVTDQNTNKNFVYIDPVNSFFGINTSDRFINYSDMVYTTTDSIYSGKHNLYILGKTYPVMASDRIQEKADKIISDTKLSDIKTDDISYFSTYSAYTAKRTSKLYTFDEMMKYSSELTDRVIPSSDTVTHLRYGPDMSFEVRDKDDRTVELGQVGMVIDKIDDTGALRGGFGVQTNDPIGSFENSRRNLMYVDNSSTLFVKQINLNGGVLSTDSSGDLFWNNKKVVTE